jgi:hypothetical protein
MLPPDRKAAMPWPRSSLPTTGVDEISGPIVVGGPNGLFGARTAARTSVCGGNPSVQAATAWPDEFTASSSGPMLAALANVWAGSKHAPVVNPAGHQVLLTLATHPERGCGHVPR